MSLGRGLGRHNPSDAPDHVNGRSGKPRADSDFPRRLLGAHGVRNDGRHRRWHSPDAALPTGPLRRVVPRQASRRSNQKGDSDSGRTSAR